MAKSSKKKPSSATTNTKNSEDCKSTNSDIVKTKRRRKTIPRDSPPQRSSSYRGVTKHRLTGRYEAHLWDKNCWNESQGKKGRQVYLGAYNDEQAAAHAYDLAALKYWGHEAVLNFDIDSYQAERKEMEGQKKEEYIGSLRRKSSGFSRGVSKYRGVARHHHNGRWEARIGRVFGNKYLYLGTYATQEEAAAAYDKAAVEYRGLNAITNFDLSRYIKSLRPEEKSTTDDSIMQNSSNTEEKSVDMQNDCLSVSDDTKVSLLNLTSDAKTSKLKEMSECNSISSSISEPEAPKSSFPDDIQTSFEFQDTSSFTEEHDAIFGDYDSLLNFVNIEEGQLTILP